MYIVTFSWMANTNVNNCKCKDSDTLKLTTFNHYFVTTYYVLNITPLFLIINDHIKKKN